MNSVHTIRSLAGLAAATVTYLGAAVPAALATRDPGHPAGTNTPAARQPQPALSFPPGWNKHPPLPDPARVHAALADDIPGWQLTRWRSRPCCLLPPW